MDYLIIWDLCTILSEREMYFVTLMNKNFHEATAQSTLTTDSLGCSGPHGRLPFYLHCPSQVS